VTSWSFPSIPIRIAASKRCCHRQLEPLHEQGVVVRPREPPRDRGEHVPEEEERQVAVAGVVADDDRDELRPLGHEPAAAGSAL
jgi:hypothetical protein